MMARINASTTLLRKINEQLCDRWFICARNDIEIVRVGRKEDDDSECAIVQFPAGGRKWGLGAWAPESEPPLGRVELRTDGQIIVAGPLHDDTWAGVLRELREPAHVG